MIILLLQAIGKTLDNIVIDAQKGLRGAEKIGNALLPGLNNIGISDLTDEVMPLREGFSPFFGKSLMELNYAQNELKAFYCCLEPWPPAYHLASAKGILRQCQNAMYEAKVCPVEKLISSMAI